MTNPPRYRTTGRSPDAATTVVSLGMAEPVILDCVQRLVGATGLGFGVDVSVGGATATVVTHVPRPDTLYLACWLPSERARSPDTAARMERIGLAAGPVREEFDATVPRTDEGAIRAARLVLEALREVGPLDADAEVRIRYRDVRVKAWQVIGIVATLAGLSAPALYWLITESGPARPIIRWFASWDRGRYSPTIVFGVLFIMNSLVAFGLLGIVSAIARLLRRGKRA